MFFALFQLAVYAALIKPEIDNCTLAPGEFSDEINSLVNTPFNFDKFTKINPNKKRCEYMKFASFSVYNTVYNFTCPKEACFRWCSYNNNCLYSMFSKEEKTCTRTTKMELSDNYKESKLYFSNKIITFARNTEYPPRYYSQKCNSYFGKRPCNRDKQCAWKKGRRGYNREVAVLGSGWCGRVKCLK